MPDRRTHQKLFGLVVTGAALMLYPAVAGAQETQQRDTTGTRQEAGTQDTSAMGRATLDTAGQDSTHWGYDTSDTSSNVQNPPGYRGMERPVNVFPPDSGDQQGKEKTPAQVEDQVTGTYDDSSWQDTSKTDQQNPAGYRGMERPVGGDTAAADTAAVRSTDTTGADTIRVGDTESPTPSDTSRRLPAARDDTAGQAASDTGTATDTTGQ